MATRLPNVVVAAFGALGLITAACSLLFPISDEAASSTLEEGGATSFDVPADSGASDHANAELRDATYRCAQTGRGPDLVALGDRACIDESEVTFAQYDAFLDAGVTPRSDIPQCKGKTSFTPRGTSKGPHYPVHGVDWCDAFEFCAWAGKALCGPFPGATLEPVDAGPDGSVHGLTLDALVDREKNLWQWACQGGDAGFVYPYGNDEVPNACWPAITKVFNAVEMGEVMSRGQCEGGFPGVFDMVGNVSEWVDSCKDGACVYMGASVCREFHYLNFSVPVDFFDFAYKDGKGSYGALGFRCCGLDAPERVP